MMEVQTLLHAIQRRWWLVLLPATLVLALSVPSLLQSPTPSYTVGMRFTAAAPSDVAIDDLASYEDSVYVPWLASEYVVVNLPQWVTSDSFAQEVSTILDRQNIEISSEDARTAFIADSARSILVVYVVWDDEAETEALAEAAIEVLQTRNQVYFPQFAAHPAEVQPLDDVRVTAAFPPLSERLGPLIQVAIALMAGLFLAVLVEYFDDTIRRADELADLDLPLLASIPEA